MSTSPNLATERAETDLSAGERVERSWRAIGSIGQLLTVLSGATALVVAASWAATTRYALAAGLSLVLLVVAAMVDVVERRLPNALLVAAFVPVAVGGIIGYVLDPEVLVSMLVGCAVMVGPLLLAHLVSPSGMGFGDVKAAAVLGGAIGLIDDDLAIPALLAALAFVAVWGLVRRERTVPFGPGLVAGALLVITVGRVVLR